jgi:HK97 family phage major capsid protein
VARAVEYALLTEKDNGTSTVLPNSPAGGLLGSVTAGVTAAGGTLAAGPTYSLLSQLKSSVDHAYAVGPKSGFMGSQSVYNFLFQQVDSTGRPLYKHDPETGLLIVAGSPFYVASNAAMPAYNAASSPVVLFDDYSRAYAYQNGGGMRIKILAERYVEQFEAAAVIYHRMGAAKLVSGAVKSLVTAAS